MYDIDEQKKTNDDCKAQRSTQHAQVLNAYCAAKISFYILQMVSDQWDADTSMSNVFVSSSIATTAATKKQQQKATSSF